MRHSTQNLQHTVLEGKHKRQSRKRRPAVEGLEERALLSAAHDLAVHKHFAVPVPVHKHHTVPPVPVHKPANNYETIPLVSNAYINEIIHDPSLVDPWDINFPQLPGIDPPVWVADQGTGVVTMYQITNDGSTVTKSPFTVTIPAVPQSISTQTGPTGVVYDPLNKFSMPGSGGSVPATYIFDTLQGTIDGYDVPHNNSSTGILNPAAEIVVNNSSTAEYTGLAAGTVDGKHYIYAANDAPGGGIEVYNDSFDRWTFKAGNFLDKKLTAEGFTPYGVHDLGKMLIVTYRGPNFVGGAVAEFMNDGKFVKRFAFDATTSGTLESPWGAAVLSMPKAAKAAGFGQFAPDVLVSNFSSGQIDAYNFMTGQFEGTLDAGVLRSLSPVSGLSISAPAWGLPGKRRSPCSSPQIHSMGIMSRSTARSGPSPSPRDLFVKTARVITAIPRTIEKEFVCTKATRARNQSEARRSRCSIGERGRTVPRRISPGELPAPGAALFPYSPAGESRS